MSASAINLRQRALFDSGARRSSVRSNLLRLTLLKLQLRFTRSPPSTTPGGGLGEAVRQISGRLCDLDLDHLRAEVAQHHCRVGTDPGLGEVDHAQAVQRQVPGCGQSTSVAQGPAQVRRIDRVAVVRRGTRPNRPAFGQGDADARHGERRKAVLFDGLVEIAGLELFVPPQIARRKQLAADNARGSPGPRTPRPCSARGCSRRRRRAPCR